MRSRALHPVVFSEKAENSRDETEIYLVGPPGGIDVRHVELYHLRGRGTAPGTLNEKLLRAATRPFLDPYRSWRA